MSHVIGPILTNIYRDINSHLIVGQSDPDHVRVIDLVFALFVVEEDRVDEALLVDVPDAREMTFVRGVGSEM